MFVTLLKTYIRPVMEYGAPAYHPCTVGEANLLERVQRLGTRMVPQLHGLPYLQRCKELNLFTLAYRRLRADLIFIYRVIVAKLHPDMAHLLPLAAD